jgi:ribosomal protein S12 methylthiotransferase
VGCFKYSPVEGAAANALPAHVPAPLQEERYARFMERASAISAARLKRHVGSCMRVLVDAIDGDTAIARSTADAPEIDGVVRISGARALAIGDWADVKILRADAYDLSSRLLS